MVHVFGAVEVDAPRLASDVVDHNVIDSFGNANASAEVALRKRHG